MLELQRQAIQGIFPNAGQFRQIPIYIQNTSHNPPDWPEVPKLVSEMCDYANTHQTDAVHVASYLMWRLNWIHPFNDGNGRTSRAVSYLALCAGLGMELPGTVTVPELIVRDRDPYYAALDKADAAWKLGTVDVSGMESLMTQLLTEQLQSAVRPSQLQRIWSYIKSFFGR